MGAKDRLGPVEVKPLGKTGIEVSPVIFGTMARDPNASPAERESLVRRAIERGLVTLDTAPLYEFGDSERWVGRAIRDQRDAVVLATKVGLRWDADHGDVLFAYPDADGRTVSVRKDGRPRAIRADVEGSLERLGVDYIDVIQVHHPDRHTPIASTIETLMRLRDEGKVRAIGVSNFDLEQTQEAFAALGAGGLACLQLPYSLLDRQVENGLGRWASEHGVPIWAYSPLAEGALAKDITFSWQAEGWLRHPANRSAITRFTRTVVDPVAKVYGVSRAAVSIAWLSSRNNVFPIVGASRLEHVDDAAKGAALRLSTKDLGRLDAGSQALTLNYRAGYRRRDRALARLLEKVTRFTARIRRPREGSFR